MTQKALEQPLYASGVVVQGFGRGSRELGIPTANFDEQVVKKAFEDVENGIYYGYARVAHEESENCEEGDDLVYPMVMSVGWNPFYKNEKKSAEVHIIRKYAHDFYGKELRIVVLGYLRPERNYDSLDDLIKDIHNDIQVAGASLKQDFPQFKLDKFLIN